MKRHPLSSAPPLRRRQWGAIFQPPSGGGTTAGPGGTSLLLGGSGEDYRRNDVMYNGEISSQAMGASPSVANLLVAWPFRTGIGGTLANLKMNVSGAGAGNNFRMGVYANVSPVQIYPGALLFDSGPISAAVVGVKTAAVNLLVAAGGLLWLVFNCDSAVPSYSGSTGTNAAFPIGHSIANPPSTGQTHFEFANGAFTLPNPFPAGATLVNPATGNSTACPFVQWA